MANSLNQPPSQKPNIARGSEESTMLSSEPAPLERAGPENNTDSQPDRADSDRAMANFFASVERLKKWLTRKPEEGESLWKPLISWGVVSALVLTGIGIGVEFLGMTPPDFTFAKVCFISSAVILLAKVAHWLSNPKTSRAERMILSFLIFGIVGLGLVEALYWVRDRQQLSMAAAAQTAQPTSVTQSQPSTPTPTINPVSPPSAKEIAEEVAKHLNLSPTQVSQTQHGLREILIPANDQTPPNICDDQKDIVSRFANRDSMKLALLGPAAALYPQREKPISLITIAGQSVLEVEGARTGIVLNATLRDETGRLLAEIKKNVWQSHAPNDYDVRSDNNQILILNSKNQVILFVRYLNPNTIKVLGTFNVPNRPTVTVEEGQILIGKRKLVINACAIDSAPEGSWAQMKSLLEIP